MPWLRGARFDMFGTSCRLYVYIAVIGVVCTHPHPQPQPHAHTPTLTHTHTHMHTHTHTSLQDAKHIKSCTSQPWHKARRRVKNSNRSTFLHNLVLVHTQLYMWVFFSKEQHQMCVIVCTGGEYGGDQHSLTGLGKVCM